MANAIVTIKIMPESPSTDLEALEKKVVEYIEEFVGETETQSVTEPVAFGIKALKVTFVMDEQKGSPEELEKKISALEEVTSAETVDVRRAVG